MTCGVAFAVVIGVSRVGLLAHWPSDVLGGWLLGLAVVPLVFRTVRRPRRPRDAAAATGTV